MRQQQDSTDFLKQKEPILVTPNTENMKTGKLGDEVLSNIRTAEF